MADREWDEQEPREVRLLEAELDEAAHFEGADAEDAPHEDFDFDQFDAPDDEPPLDALEELAVLEAAESAELAEARAELEQERARTQAVLDRYREAVLAAEPDLPPDLVRGASLEELDASIGAARRTVAEVRARLTEAAAASEVSPVRGFPVGAPARMAPSRAGLSAAEKIRRGLEERAHS